MLCTLRVMSPALEMHFLSNFIKQAAHTPNLNYPLCLVLCLHSARGERACADKNKAPGILSQESRAARIIPLRGDFLRVLYSMCVCSVGPRSLGDALEDALTC